LTGGEHSQTAKARPILKISWDRPCTELPRIHNNMKLLSALSYRKALEQREFTEAEAMHPWVSAGSFQTHSKATDFAVLKDISSLTMSLTFSNA
jgi:hypothetical protein